MTPITDFWDRFWSKVDVGQPDECWEWQGFTDRIAHPIPGYGTIRRKVDGVSKCVKAHRVAYESVNGAIPEGMHVLHTCDNRPCCNPAHLFLGTALDNSRDKYSKNRQVIRRGEVSGMAKLKDDDISDIRLLLSMGCTHKHIAREFGVSRTAITSIKAGHTWRHV